MWFVRLVAVVIIICISSALDARADNSISVLQFGATNLSLTSQTGTTANNSITLQFGAINQANTLQSGSISPSTINSSVIGQGGFTGTALTNTAAASQAGGSNTSVIGQIGSSNTAGASQLG